jgi:branched-chain amino acid transport system substrate-binding protein
LRALNELRPDIQVLGDDVHPLQSVKDFSGYLARIRDSGADAIMTADRGADLVGIMKAAAKLGSDAQILVLSSSVTGAPAVIGKRGENRVTGVFTWHSNIGSSLIDLFAEDYRSKHDEDWNGLPVYVAIQMLVTSMETARSTDPLQTALVLEGLSFLGANGPTAMRDDNHQLLQPLFLATLASPGGDVKHPAAGAKLGWKTVSRKEPDETWLNSTCKMVRPKGVKRR